MLRKMTAILALVAAPFAVSQADNTLPNVLAGLDSSIQVMDEQQLNEVRGTGPLPGGFQYREYYLAWNNYGSQSDYRSYSQHSMSIQSGGKTEGNGARVGEAWLISTTPGAYGLNSNGPHTKVEEHSFRLTEVGNDLYDISNVISGSGWNRPWDGYYRIHANHF